jgi:mannose-1-phosphate guanylyltransferase
MPVMPQIQVKQYVGKYRGVGVNNLAVVETEKAILVCNLKKSQDVKNVVEELKNNSELNKYL